MKEKIEYILNAILFISTQDKVEELFEENQVTIIGIKKRTFINDKFKLFISKSKNANDMAKVTIIVKGETKESMDLHIPILFDMLSKARLLNENIKSKIIKLSGFQEVIRNIEIVVITFKFQIENVWAELSDFIDVRSENNNIVFELDMELNDPEFRAFFHYAILLKAVVSNCKNNGVEKIIFIDKINNQFDEISINELEKMKLK